MNTELFPAIDVKDGMVVRLLRGDYEKMTVYGDSPLEMAFIFEEHGANWLHLVDLDGARDGVTNTSKAVKTITSQTKLKLEVGGGIRTEYQIEDYLRLGVERVILGTAALTDLDFTKEMIKKYGPGIAVGIDVKDGYAAIKGWEEISGYTKDDAFKVFCDMGVDYILSNHPDYCVRLR